MVSKSRQIVLVACAASLPFLVGCTNTPAQLDSPAHEALLKQDQADRAQFENRTIDLTVSKAIERAVNANLDARVAATQIIAQKKNVTLKELEALPSIEASRGIYNRSNDGASSSRSVLSGLESLEPSQSTDQRRFVSEIEASWNMMDAIVTLVEADRARDEVSITKERYVKVVQNIERDVYAAYWRAWAHQSTATTTQNLLSEARAQIANLTKAQKEKLISSDQAAGKITELGSRVRSLEEINSKLSMANAELKALLSYPHSAKLNLSKPDDAQNRIRELLAENPVDQEWRALKNRPEMREEILQKNAAIKDIHHEIIKTFPGGEVMFGYHQDSNSFLQDDEWNTFSYSIAQNIIGLLTLPARMDAAKKKEQVADARRQALNMAIVTQVNLGRIRLSEAEKIYRDSRTMQRSAAQAAYALSRKSGSGFSSKGDTLIAKMDSQIETVRSLMALAEREDSYAALKNALGISLLEKGGNG